MFPEKQQEPSHTHPHPHDTAEEVLGSLSPGARSGRNGHWAPRGSGPVGAAFGFASEDTLTKSRRLSAFLPVPSPPR